MTLTKRTKQALLLHSIGLSYDEVARAMGIARSTAIMHVRLACARLGAQNSRHATSLAYVQHLITDYELKKELNKHNLGYSKDDYDLD